MRFQKLFALSLFVSLCVVVPANAFAQSQPAPASQVPANTGSPSSPPEAQAAPLPNATPARVWTNEDMGTLRQKNGISVVGNNPPKKVSATSKTGLKPLPQEKDPAWYRKQLAPLQVDIEKLDPQIAKLKILLSGQTVNDQLNANRRATPTPKDQLKQLEAKRRADEDKMDDLLDRARHNDIEPGALR
jgi:hypothetical protein